MEKTDKTEKVECCKKCCHCTCNQSGGKMCIKLYFTLKSL